MITRPLLTTFATILAASLLPIALFFLSGCDQHLGGTHDVQLDYHFDPMLGGDGKLYTSSDVAQLVQTRLILAEANADVDALDTDKVRVTIDSDEAAYANAMILWRGGLKVFRVDPAFPFSPSDTTGLTPKMDGDDHYWVGATSAINRATAGSPAAKGHYVFSEPVDQTTSRTRVVFDDPIVDLSGQISTIGLVDSARSVVATPTPAGLDSLKQAAASYPGAVAAVARGAQLMATIPLDQVVKSPIVMSSGSDIASYTRAYYIRRVLLSPVLPPMHVLTFPATPVPAKWPIAIACVVLPMLVSFGWLFFVRQFDRARPEPLWLVLATFALGGVSCILAAFAEIGLEKLSPYLNPQIMTLGQQLYAAPIALAVFTLTVGVSEEGSKFLGAWTLARHRKEFDEPVDGIVYGCASALGFAAVENIKYFAANRLALLVVTGRTFTSVPLHMFVGAIWGYALGRKLVRKKTSVLLFFLLAAFAHGLFDTMLSFPQTGVFGMVVLIGLGVLFAGLLRGALRHGAMRPDSKSDGVPESRNRVFFRMGSALQFTAWVIALITLAASIMFIGELYEQEHRRLTVAFLAVSTGLLSLFGLASYGIATTIPLDVAVDPAGVTFAGAASEWKTIVGLDKRYARGIFGHRGWLHLRTEGGVVRLGPANPQVIEQLAGVVQSYLGILRTGARGPAAGSAAASPVPLAPPAPPM